MVAKWLDSACEMSVKCDHKNQCEMKKGKCYTYYSDMAKLSQADVLKLAKLARLSLSGDEAAQFSIEITSILEYVEQLQNVDLKDLKPTFQVTGLVNVTRPDEVRDYGATSTELLQNAPATEAGQFKVKRMVG